MLIAKSKDHLITATQPLETSKEGSGSKINERKTKYTLMGTEARLRSNSERYNFEKVEEFMYLGVRIVRNAGEEMEMEARLSADNRMIHLNIDKYVI